MMWHWIIEEREVLKTEVSSPESTILIKYGAL
jgi:hypothetical protein